MRPKPRSRTGPADPDGARPPAAAAGDCALARSSSLSRGGERGSSLAAALTGAGVGVAGGLLGLGGAEFRLPVLVGYFRYGLLRAISLNLAVSLVTVLAAASSRLTLARQIPDVSAWPVGVAMMLGGMLRSEERRVGE